MKKLKYIIIAFLLIVSFKNVNAQIQYSNGSTFYGTWYWQNGVQIFKVHLFEQDQTIKGHYEMLQIHPLPNGMNETTVIYTSDKPLNSATSLHWYPVINAGLSGDSNYVLHGSIMDISMDYEEAEYAQYDLWDAWLEMKILPANCNTCPMTATWKVDYRDLVPANAMPLNIPTDIVLTKVN